MEEPSAYGTTKEGIVMRIKDSKNYKEYLGKLVKAKSLR